MDFLLFLDTSGMDPEMRARGWVMDQEKIYNDLVAKADSMAKKKEGLQKEMEKLAEDEKALQKDIAKQKKTVIAFKESFRGIDFGLLKMCKNGD